MASETVRTFLTFFYFFFQNPENMIFYVFFQLLHTFSRTLAGLMRSRAWAQIAAATLSGNSLRQTVHIHRASVHQAAKLVAALLRVARVTSGLSESNGSLMPGL